VYRLGNIDDIRQAVREKIAAHFQRRASRH
jgi:hypothetical protein